jgi:F-type H+-transporting ATPase subunit delta
MTTENRSADQNGQGDRYSHGAEVGVEHVAKVYAGALLNVAEQRHQAEAILEELEALARLVTGENQELRGFFLSGLISRERRAATIKQVFAGRADDLLVDFLQVLNEHDRLDLVRAVAAVYKNLRDERAHRRRVHVTTAVPLADDQRDKLLATLRQNMQLDPVLELRVDPDLLGGMTVQVGDYLLDASLRARLDTIKNQLITRSSHEIQSGRDRFSSAS